MLRWTLALFIVLSGAPAGGADPAAPDSVSAAGGDTLVVSVSSSLGPGSTLFLLRRPALTPDRMLLSFIAPAPTRVPLTPRPVLFEASRYQTTILGADKGAYMGLAAGFLGEWLGVWDERTALAIMGAGAAAGGLWGGTAGYHDPGLRIRVKSEN